MSAERDHAMERLAIAEQHVADTERHITEQLARIERMGGDEQAIKDAEKLLVPLNALLMEWTTQRDAIVKHVEELDLRNH